MVVNLNGWRLLGTIFDWIQWILSLVVIICVAAHFLITVFEHLVSTLEPMITPAQGSMDSGGGVLLLDDITVNNNGNGTSSVVSIFARMAQNVGFSFFYVPIVSMIGLVITITRSLLIRALSGLSHFFSGLLKRWYYDTIFRLLRDLYLFGPTIGAYGFWQGVPPTTICATWTAPSKAENWEGANLPLCEAMIDTKVYAWAFGIQIVVCLLLVWRQANRCPRVQGSSSNANTDSTASTGSGNARTTTTTTTTSRTNANDVVAVPATP